jgi:WD40 repeat protein
VGLGFSPDGRRVLSASRPDAGPDESFGELRIWDTSTGRVLFAKHARGITAAAYSPTGTYAAAGASDGVIALRNPSNGELIRELAKPQESEGLLLHGLACDAKGERIVSCAGNFDTGLLNLWDVASGQRLRSWKFSGPGRDLQSTAVSPDGTRITSADGSGTITLWNAVTGKEVRSMRGHTGHVFALAFSPDGTRLATAGWDRMVRLWDTSTGGLTRTMWGHTSFVHTVAFSPDGNVIASAGEGVVKLWEAESGQEVAILRGHNGAVLQIAFSPDGRRLASGGQDAMVKLWDLDDPHIRPLVHHGWVSAVAFSPDGTVIASASRDRTVKLWGTSTGRELFTFRGHQGDVLAVRFSPDGKRIASAGLDQTVKLWDPATGEILMSLECTSTEGGVGLKQGMLAFSPDGRRLAGCQTPGNTSAGEVRVWDAATGQRLLTIPAHSNHINAVTYSPDGTRLATASNDKTIKLWEAATGEEILTLRGHNAGVLALAFSPDGQRLATGSIDHTVRIWEAPRDDGTPLSGATLVNAARGPRDDETAAGDGTRTIERAGRRGTAARSNERR